MTAPPRLSGLVAAAGRSTRMGTPKALLRFGDECALGRLLRVFRAAGVAPIRVVVNETVAAALVDAARRGEPAAILDRPDLRVVHNDAPGSGLSDSIRLALRAHPPAADEAVLLCPVDVPLVEAADIAALVAGLDDPRRPAVVVPRAPGGRRGHPALFGPATARELARLGDDEPAHSVVRRDPSRVLELPLPNPELYADLDHPEDYEAARRRDEIRRARLEGPGRRGENL